MRYLTKELFGPPGQRQAKGDLALNLFFVYFHLARLLGDTQLEVSDSFSTPMPRTHTRSSEK